MNHTGPTSAGSWLGSIEWADALLQAVLAAITAFIVGRTLLKAEWNKSRRDSVHSSVARVVDARYSLTGRMVSFPYSTLGTNPGADPARANTAKALVSSALVELRRRVAIFELELGAGKTARGVRDAIDALEAHYDAMVVLRTGNGYLVHDDYRRGVYELSHAVDTRLTEHIKELMGIDVNIPWAQNQATEGET